MDDKSMFNLKLGHFHFGLKEPQLGCDLQVLTCHS